MSYYTPYFTDEPADKQGGGLTDAEAGTLFRSTAAKLGADTMCSDKTAGAFARAVLARVAPSVPEGYALVPVELIQDVVDGTGQFDNDPQAKQHNRYCAAVGKLRAMLAAAPQPSEKQAEQVEYLDVQNHRLRRAIQKMMARLTDLLDEDRFAEMEGLATDAGVEPQPSEQPAEGARGVDAIQQAIHQMEMEQWHWKSDKSTDSKRSAHAALVALLAAPAAATGRGPIVK